MKRFRSPLLLMAMASAVTFHCEPSGAQVADLSASNDIPAEFPAATQAYDHTRREVMIPMRDGVKLFTVIMAPRHAAAPMPIILTRTPYDAGRRATARDGASPSLALSVRAQADHEPLVRNGYILVFQDVRGKYGSEGAYILNRPLRGPLNRSDVDHSTDAWDTIDWLVRNVPGNNGRVGITGCSYDGFLTLMALFDPHPALKAAIPVNAMVDGWMGDDWYHNGAFRQQMADWFLAQMSTKAEHSSLAYGYLDLYRAFLDAGSAAEFGRRHHLDRLPAWNRTLDNPAYTEFWRVQALHRLLESVELTVPTMTVHGLFDQEDMFGPLASYAVLEKKDARNDRNHLVIGPWFHGQTERSNGSSIGKIALDADTARHYREQIRQVFLDEHLKGIKPSRPLPAVLAFETGANAWREYAAWPPTSDSQVTRLYLRAANRASFEPPAAEGHTEYVSDPAKPIPYRARPIPAGYDGWEVWLADDQRHAVDRTDVVTFVSEPLASRITVRGEVVARLFASTTGTDADWVVKVIDNYPEEYPARPGMGGFQLMVAGDIFRGRYRESFETARPIAPGKVLPYRIALPHVNHTFLPGHRIMVQIQSSWFPLYDRNPQRFVPNIAHARPEDFQRATHRIHHSNGAASYIELPVASAQ